MTMITRSGLFLILTLALVLIPAISFGDGDALGTYLAGFDYAERRDMKISSVELADKLKADEVVLIDIRFKEEAQAWKAGFSRNIPLNELPGRLDELPKDKLIVTACPHKDRAIIAMVYLKTRGYDVKYLKDGLIDLMELLRGDEALELQKALPAKNSRTQDDE